VGQKSAVTDFSTKRSLRDVHKDLCATQVVSSNILDCY